MRAYCVVSIVIAMCMSAAALADEATTQPAAVTDDAFDAALEKAASAEPGSEEFVAALQSVAPRFEAIQPSTEPGAGAWNKVTLNARGKRVDAIRFRVPEGERRDLFWALSFPKSMDRWYIAPAEGPAGQGFSSFQRAQPARLFKEKPPQDYVGILQALSAEHLEPGREYLIWFMFKDEKPADVFVAMALLPATDDPSDLATYKALGLPLPRPETAE